MGYLGLYPALMLADPIIWQSSARLCLIVLLRQQSQLHYIHPNPSPLMCFSAQSQQALQSPTRSASSQSQCSAEQDRQPENPRSSIGPSSLSPALRAIVSCSAKDLNSQHKLLDHRGSKANTHHFQPIVPSQIIVTQLNGSAEPPHRLTQYL